MYYFSFFYFQEVFHVNTKGTLLFQDWRYTSISGQYETLLHQNYRQYCGSISSIVLVLT